MIRCIHICYEDWIVCIKFKIITFFITTILVKLYVMFGILLARGNHLYYCIISLRREVCTHKTCITSTSFFFLIKCLCQTRNASDHICMCYHCYFSFYDFSIIFLNCVVFHSITAVRYWTRLYTRTEILYNAKNKRYVLLGHSVILQALWDKRYDNPPHALPPWAGAGLLHFLVLLPVSIPGPHVVLQTPLHRTGL